MQYTPRLLALLAATALASSPIFAAEEATDTPKPLESSSQASEPAKKEELKPIVVNGKTISTEMLAEATKMRLSRGLPDNAETSKNIAKDLVNQELLVQEGKASGAFDTQEFKAQMELSVLAIHANAAARQFLAKNKVSDAAIKEKYEELTKSMGGEENNEFKVSHILVKEEADADKVLAELKEGKNFADLAKEYSVDPGSKESGGDLGWSRAQNYVPEFSDALKKMKKGEHSQEPVKTMYGYHIIFLEDVRQATPPGLEQIKPQVEQMVQREMLDKHIEELKKKAKISGFDDK